MTDAPWYDEVPVPRLMREARGAYGDAVRRALAEGECDDVPRNGAFVLANLDPDPEPSFSPQADMVVALRLSKQAASQLIDTLVLRGYLERRSDPDDRRRMGVRLTERGRAAAAWMAAAVATVDATLEQRITAEELRGLRAGLAALAEIRDEESSD